MFPIGEIQFFSIWLHLKNILKIFFQVFSFGEKFYMKFKKLDKDSTLNTNFTILKIPIPLIHDTKIR